MQRKQSVPPPRASSVSDQHAGDLDTLCAALLGARPGAAARTARHRGARRRRRTRRADRRGRAPGCAESPGAELIGRQAELDALRAAFATAATGQAVVAHVSGESGVGKSTLVRAFLDELRAHGSAVVLSGRCYERESVPYKAFDRVIDALTRFLRRLPDDRDRDADPARHRRARAHLSRCSNASRSWRHAPARTAPDDQELRRRAFDAFAELIAGIRDRQMLVLHIDDLQWIDHDSTLLFEHLLGQPDPPPSAVDRRPRGSVAENRAARARRRRGARATRRSRCARSPSARSGCAAARELATRLLQGSGADARTGRRGRRSVRGQPVLRRRAGALRGAVGRARRDDVA